MKTHFGAARIVPLALTFVLLLCACGGETPYEPAATADALLESGAFSEHLESIDQDVACLLYGLDESTVTDSAVYGSTGATAEELAVFTLTDEEAAEAARAALETRISDQRAAYESYIPEEVTKLDVAILDIRGSSVLLVVAADIEAAEAALD